MFTRRDASNNDRSQADDTTTRTPPPAPPLPVQQPAPSVAPVAQTNIRSSDESLVAREDTFEGQLRTARGVRVMGTVRGGIESEQYVHVEENAKVEADITAEEVVIAGEYVGKLTCRQRVEIRATGRVSGTIDTVKLLLHEGGYFDGELHMQKTPPAAATPPAKPESEESRPRRTRYVDIGSNSELSSSSSREVGVENPGS